MARPTRPTHLKILAGDREDRINRDEPTPAETQVVPPVELSGVAREVWDRLAPDLIAKHVLTAWDVDMFAVYCQTVAVYRECKALMGNQYTARGAAGGVIKSPYWQIMRDCADAMATIGSRFGLTPADRSKLSISPDQPIKSGAERILT